MGWRGDNNLGCGKDQWGSRQADATAGAIMLHLMIAKTVSRIECAKEPAGADISREVSSK